MSMKLLAWAADPALAAFRHQAAYLFLGAAFVAVGLVAAAISILRHKVDRLWLWLAVFALLYGARLWLQTDFVAMLLPHTVFVRDLRSALNYLVAIPAFFYFQAAGYLSRGINKLLYPLIAIMVSLIAGVFLFGNRRIFDTINSITVVIALLVLAYPFLRTQRNDREFRLIRLGLFSFIGLALWDNAMVMLSNISNTWIVRSRVEPFGFLIFLAALGYVAARRNLDRDAQFAAVQKELEVAQEIQRSILPTVFPESKNFRVAARYVPMRSVAGDFYDFPLTSDDETGLLIADVSGHGVPAALIASMVKLAAASQREHVADPAAYLAGMNAVLCGNTQSQFVTAAYVHLNAASAEMRYAAAAHPPMLLLRKGKVSEVVENGLMLGAFDTAAYEMMTHALKPGDRLLLYTDGIMEAANAQREEFGRERLSALLRDQETLSHDGIADLILSTVQQWSITQEDDLTVLVCDYQRG